MFSEQAFVEGNSLAKGIDEFANSCIIQCINLRSIYDYKNIQRRSEN